MNQRSLYVSGEVDWDFIVQNFKNNQITKLIIGSCGHISRYRQTIDNIKYLHVLDETFDYPESVLYFVYAISKTVQSIQIDNANVLRAFYRNPKYLPCLEIIRSKNNIKSFFTDFKVPSSFPKLRIIDPICSDWSFNRIENKKCLTGVFVTTLYHITVNQMHFQIMFTLTLCLRRFFVKDLAKMIIQKCNIDAESLVKKQLLLNLQFAPYDKRTDEENVIFRMNSDKKDAERELEADLKLLDEYKMKVAQYEKMIEKHKKKIEENKIGFDLEYEKLLKKIEK